MEHKQLDHFAQLAALTLLSVIVALSLLMGIGEVVGGDASGVIHLAQTLPLLVLLVVVIVALR